MRSLCLSSALCLFVASSGCGEDLRPSSMETDDGANGSADSTSTGEDVVDGSGDSTDGTAGTSGGMGCDAPNPECTTGNACGNGEICVDCQCVPTPDECPDPATANCISDADCPSGESCGPTCLCSNEECADPKANQCTSSNDCPRGQQCAFMGGEGCDCYPPCECGDDEDPPCDRGMTCDGCSCVALPGETDPEDDCTDDFGDVTCNPSIDIVGTTVECLDGGDISVSVFYAETPVEPLPATNTVRTITFQDEAGDGSIGLFAVATTGPEPSPYECDLVIPGVMVVPLGPGDSCGISPDGNTFEFVMSADSILDQALGAVSTVDAFASSQEPMFHSDRHEAVPVDCP